MQVFLEGNRNKFARNEETVIGLDLESTQKVLPKAGKISSVLSLYEQYNAERDSCDKYRLIFTVNPICSNVLYNVKTEIVIDEGTDNCKFLNYDGSVPRPSNAINTTQRVNVEQALDDTEYSNPDIGGFVYHCGIDIFKNHRLRSEGFHFFKSPSKSDALLNYNTISSYLTDGDGNVVEERIVLDSNSGRRGLTKLHAYTMDNLMDFQVAYTEGVREVDGWYGFYNVGSINIPNKTVRTDTLDVNRVINNNKQCEFIDFYPDRSLFSFIPKVNKARRRLENNWDYCLTYPAESDASALITWGVTDGDGNIRLSDFKSGRTDGGSYTLSFRSIVPHGLSLDNYVVLSLSINGSESTKSKCRVIGIGDINGNDKSNVFTIRYYDVSSIVPIYESGTTKSVCIESITAAGFKRISGSMECKYYARKLKKIGNLRSECNKIAGGKNIYGDKFAQIVFTDDVNVPMEGLKTNLGTPVTDIYLTVVKRAVGGDEFYKNGNCGSKDVEFSHCFGKVTSGIKLPDYVSDYNIYKLNNVGDEVRRPKIIEDNITISGFDEFYYDIVEFDQSSVSEKQLEMVYHRFNTYQRECDGNISDFGTPINIKYIQSDDYTPKLDGSGLSGFSISSTTIGDNGTTNIMPEGYFYQHSFGVKIRELSELKTCRLDVLMNGVTVVNLNEQESGDTGFTGYYFPYAIASETDFGMVGGEELCLVVNDGSVLRTRFKNYSDGYIHLEIVDGDDTITELEYSGLYRLLSTCPDYAIFNPRNSSLIWRDVVPYSELGSNSELYDMTFSNGALYKHTNINFFLQRQDPYNEHGLRDSNVDLAEYVPVWKERIDLSEATFFYNNLTNICF